MAEKSVLQKLMLKPGRSFLLVNPPPGYPAKMGALPEGARLAAESDVPVDIIQVFVESRAALEAQLPRLKALLHPTGALWVTYYKGGARVQTDIHRDSINAYAATLGLRGVAIIAVDEDWSALRLKRVD